ncbi:MAG: hypothetical protein ACFFDI_01080 [Promethearchaeota archaeon]
MAEPKFFREKEVEKKLETVRTKLIEDISETAGNQMYGEFFQFGLLLVGLFYDLGADSSIEKIYISKMKDGYAKKVAQAALEAAKNVLIEEGK